MAYGEYISVTPFFNLLHLWNTGAAFSLFANAGGWQRYFFIGIAVVVSIFLIKLILENRQKGEERTLLDLLATRRQDVLTSYPMKLKDRQKVEIVSMNKWSPFYGIWNATTRLQAEAAVDEGIATTPKGQKEVSSDLIRPVANWREEFTAYFDTDMPVTNAYTESINRLAKDKNREGRGYSFEVMRARMLYTTKHKKKGTDCEDLSFLQENHRLRTAGLRKGAQLRGRSINHLRVVSD